MLPIPCQIDDNGYKYFEAKDVRSIDQIINGLKKMEEAPE